MYRISSSVIGDLYKKKIYPEQTDNYEEAKLILEKFKDVYNVPGNYVSGIDKDSFTYIEEVTKIERIIKIEK